MTDLGTADRIYVCGPDCKTLKEVEAEESTFEWKNFGANLGLALVGALAAIGFADIVLRILLDFWLF